MLKSGTAAFVMPDNPSAKSLYRQATTAALLGLVVNLALGVMKLTAGIIGGSFALISDAVNSLGDAVTSIVVLFALRVAQRPPDSEHPYGHTKAEAIAALSVALVVVMSALFIGWEALQRILIVHPIPPAWTLWLAAGNVIIKEGLYWYKLHVGRKTGSSAIIANAWDHRSDALCSLAVLVGLAVVRFAGPTYIWADEAAALVVAAAIVWTGLRLFRQSASELLDSQAGDEFVRQIRDSAAAVSDVLAVEKLWVRKSGLEYLVDIHIEVAADKTVEEGHRIGHAVKDRLLAEFVSLRDVLVHLEPYANRGSLPSKINGNTRGG